MSSNYWFLGLSHLPFMQADHHASSRQLLLWWPSTSCNTLWRHCCIERHVECALHYWVTFFVLYNAVISSNLISPLVGKPLHPNFVFIIVCISNCVICCTAVLERTFLSKVNRIQSILTLWTLQLGVVPRDRGPRCNEDCHGPLLGSPQVAVQVVIVIYS